MKKLVTLTYLLIILIHSSSIAQEWLKIDEPKLGSFKYFYVSPDNFMLVLTMENILYYSENDGAIWESAMFNLGPNDTPGFLKLGHDNEFYLTVNDNVFKFNRADKKWDWLCNGFYNIETYLEITKQGKIFSKARQYDPSTKLASTNTYYPKNSNTFITMGDDENYLMDDNKNLYQISDNGKVIQSIQLSRYFENIWLMNNSKRLLITLGSSIYIKYPGSIKIDSMGYMDYPSPNIYQITEDRDGHLIACTSRGLYKSYTNGSSWIRDNSLNEYSNSLVYHFYKTTNDKLYFTNVYNNSICYYKLNSNNKIQMLSFPGNEMKAEYYFENNQGYELFGRQKKYWFRENNTMNPVPITLNDDLIFEPPMLDSIGNLLLKASLASRAYLKRYDRNEWSEINVPKESVGYNEMTIDNKGATYVRKDNIIYRSFDLGLTWDRLPEIFNLIFDTTSSIKIFATNDGGIYLFFSSWYKSSSLFKLDITLNQWNHIEQSGSSYYVSENGTIFKFTDLSEPCEINSIYEVKKPNETVYKPLYQNVFSFGILNDIFFTSAGSTINMYDNKTKSLKNTGLPKPFSGFKSIYLDNNYNLYCSVADAGIYKYSIPIKEVTTATKHFEIQTSIDVFPNPAKNRIRFSTSHFDKIIIYNAYGSIEKQSSQNEIDISNLSPGIYMASIILDKQMIATGRFIKL